MKSRIKQETSPKKRTESKIFSLCCQNSFLIYFSRFNIGVGVSANIGTEVGIGPKVGVKYERAGRVFAVDEVKETLDLGFHNSTKVCAEYILVCK